MCDLEKKRKKQKQKQKRKPSLDAYSKNLNNFGSRNLIHKASFLDTFFSKNTQIDYTFVHQGRRAENILPRAGINLVF